MTLSGIVILAGGNSKRMGSPKAKLTLSIGETLLDYHLRHAAPLNVPIMIADNERGFVVNKELMTKTKANIFHIKDYVSFDKNADSSISNTNNKTADEAIDKAVNKASDTGGALVAIESALQALIALNQSSSNEKTPSGYLMVISCDSLIKATALWQHLSTATNQNDKDKSIFCLSDDSHLYPLLGLYRLTIEPDLRAYIDSGQRRVMRFIEPVCQRVAFEQKWQDLTNFNTPEDFVKACKALHNI